MNALSKFNPVGNIGVKTCTLTKNKKLTDSLFRFSAASLSDTDCVDGNSDDALDDEDELEEEEEEEEAGFLLISALKPSGRLDSSLAKTSMR